MPQVAGIGGRLERLTLDQLSPDWDNPRFLPNVKDSFESDFDVYAYIDKKYNAFPVADSIARHGYFESEPLIALGSKNGDPHIVLEGNRRLTALKALVHTDVRRLMSKRRWRGLPETVDLPPDYPVFVVPSREAVAPILGFRHVTGITPWDPYQQARYVASLIDGDQQLHAEVVAELIGRSATEVRSFYRNLSTVEQAEEEFGLPDAKRIIDEFGVWTRAMSSVGIRDYIGAPAPREVVEREYPLDAYYQDELGRLLVWLFGQPRSDEEAAAGEKSRAGRVINDSRQLTRLGSVLHHDDGRAALEQGRSLDEAERATLDERAQFAAALAEAHEALQFAEEHLPARFNKGLATTLWEIHALVEALLARADPNGSPEAPMQDR